jgi:Arc/MetJ-type ribon-helix-helix transcriptional regulator
MSRSGKISVALPRQQITQLRDIVEAGEYGSAAAVIREALRSFLHRRDVRAGGGARFARALQARLDGLPPEPAERVELLFDAGDAKA